MSYYAQGRAAEDARIAVLLCQICDKPMGPHHVGGGHYGTGDNWAHANCVDGISGKSRELRTCKPCGYERPVQITRRWAGGKDAEESWSLLCSACDTERAAAAHEQSARRLRAKAAAIRAKRSSASRG